MSSLLLVTSNKTVQKKLDVFLVGSGCIKTANTNVHSYFILFPIVCLSEPAVACFMLILLSSRDETLPGS